MIEEEALLWSDEGSGKFRLLYEWKLWEGGIEVDAPSGVLISKDDTTLEREVRPLIETRFEIRKQMQNHLPDFVLRLATELDVDEKLQHDALVPF